MCWPCFGIMTDTRITTDRRSVPRNSFIVTMTASRFKSGIFAKLSSLPLYSTSSTTCGIGVSMTADGFQPLAARQSVKLKITGNLTRLSYPMTIGATTCGAPFGVCKVEKRDGGVYLEQESIALSRTIQVKLHWLVEPFVERLSQNLVIASLRQTRDAVRSRRIPSVESAINHR